MKQKLLVYLMILMIALPVAAMAAKPVTVGKDRTYVRKWTATDNVTFKAKQYMITSGDLATIPVGTLVRFSSKTGLPLCVVECKNPLSMPPKPAKVITRTLPGKVITREVPSTPETIVVEGPERIVRKTVKVKVPVYVALDVTPQAQNGMFGPVNGYSTSYTSGGSINLPSFGDTGTRITNTVSATGGKGGVGVGIGGAASTSAAVEGSTEGSTSTSATGPGGTDTGADSGGVGVGTSQHGEQSAGTSAGAATDIGPVTINN